MAAASSTSSAEALKAGQAIGKYRLVRELGTRTPHAFAATESSVTGDSELVVVEVLSLAETTKEALDAFARRARRLALVRHPNLARIREVLVLKDRVVIASDFVEGDLLGDLIAQDAGKKLGLVEKLRVLADVLSGLSSIHLAPELPSASDKEGKPPLHGALDPHSVVVGTDGSTRLIHLVRASAISGKSAILAPRYTAPELLLGDETSGVRADLYAVGVLLWETLTGRRLFEPTDEKDVLARQLAGPLPLATVPDDAPWAKPLVDVAARALDVDPEKRHASAAELAGALRLAVQARLAPASRVGAAVASIAKEKIQARAAMKPAKKTAPPKSVRLPPVAAAKTDAKAPVNGETKAPAKVEVKPPAKSDPKAASAAEPTRRSKPDDHESTAKKPVPAIARGAKTLVGVPSLAEEDDDDYAETKRVEVDALRDSDLFAVEEVATAPRVTAVKKSMPPPLRPKSMAPPVPPAASSSPSAVVTETPPPAVVTAPPAEVAAASAAEAVATIAPVVTPAAEMTSAPAAPAVAANDSQIEVIPPPEDAQKKKRRAIVAGVIGGAALLLLVAVVKHASKDDGTTTPKTSAGAKPTTSAQAAAPTTTATQAGTAAATTTAPASTAFVAEPVPTEDTGEKPADTTTSPAANAADTQAATSHPASPGLTSSHSTTPPAKPRKRPPHSSYEPEGI